MTHLFDGDVRYAIKAKRMPEFVKPELPLPLLPVPKLAPEQLPTDVLTPRFPIPLYRVES
jgi:hypothetical protein